MSSRSARRALASIAAGILLAPTPAASEVFRIAGSDSMAPFLSALGQAWDVPVEVEGLGSSTGPPRLLRGEIDVASLTRPLNETERAAFRARHGREPIAFAIALDAVAIYVNAANPLEQIRPEQIESIFSATLACGESSRVERWGELGEPFDSSGSADASPSGSAGAFADRRIGVYAPPAASGTRALFRDLALCGARLNDRTRVQPGTGSVALAVAESHYAIGFATLAAATPELRALALPARDRGFSLPTPRDVRSRRYPFSRALLLLVLPDAEGQLPARVSKFLSLALSDEGQHRVEAAGFLGLPAEELQRERERVEAAGGARYQATTRTTEP